MKVVRKGVKRTGRQNFLCRGCGKLFQHAYQKTGCRPNVKLLVLHMLVRNCSIRDIKEVTDVQRQTVCRWLDQQADHCQVRLRINTYESV
uniref:IS1 family transposase n=1 Tax=Pontibacter pamirensis TaxID=2562824 RepID=UPI00138A24BA|nr:IS1 family transposase [Pontibacter pamirensis]